MRNSSAALLLALVTLPLSAMKDVYPPTITAPVPEGATTITVHMPYRDAPMLVCIGTDEAAYTSGAVNMSGNVELTLKRKAPLVAGEQISVRLRGRNAGCDTPVAAAQTVTVKPKPPESPSRPEDFGLDAVSKGDTVVTGRAFSRGVLVQELDDDNAPVGPALPAGVNEFGQFAARLPDKLDCGYSVQVFERGERDGSGRWHSFQSKPIACPPPAAPSVVIDPTEGATSVSGTASTSLDKVDVVVRNGEVIVQHKSGAVDSKDGSFSVAVDKLGAGQTLELRGVSGSRHSAPLTKGVIPLDYNWGRVRAYFTAGAILARDDGSFGNQDPFLGFNIDKSLILNPRPAGWGRIRLNSFFDTRLASIAVAPASGLQKSTIAGSDSGPSTGTGAGSGTASGTSGSGTAANDPLGTFVHSQKAAVLQVGVYAPVVFATWSARGNPNSIAVGPLAKIGFATPTSDTQQRFFPFYGFGARLGHYREYQDEGGNPRRLSRNYAPELIDYLDVVVGRFKNFEARNGSSPGCFDDQLYGTLGCHRLELPRASFEGILKVPYTPFIVGFNANVSLSRRKNFVQPGDDLRFLFGTRFDVAKLFAKLLSF